MHDTRPKPYPDWRRLIALIEDEDVQDSPDVRAKLERQLDRLVGEALGIQAWAYDAPAEYRPDEPFYLRNMATGDMERVTRRIWLLRDANQRPIGGSPIEIVDALSQTGLLTVTPGTKALRLIFRDSEGEAWVLDCPRFSESVDALLAHRGGYPVHFETQTSYEYGLDQPLEVVVAKFDSGPVQRSTVRNPALALCAAILAWKEGT